MKSNRICLTLALLLSTAALAAYADEGARIEAAAPVPAQQDDRRLGEHPAIIARRVHAAQGFDYAGTFYPHPAWLFLSSVPPRTEADQASRLATSSESSERGDVESAVKPSS